MVDYSDDRRRVGRFSISQELINESPQVARQVLEGMIVVRAEAVPHLDAIEYMAISEHFDVIEQGGVAPEYVATILRTEIHDDDGPTGEFTTTIDGWERRP